MASQDEYQQQQFFKQRGVWSKESDKFPSCSFKLSAKDVEENCYPRGFNFQSLPTLSNNENLKTK